MVLDSCTAYYKMYYMDTVATVVVLVVLRT
jgi:hypothetical protein